MKKTFLKLMVLASIFTLAGCEFTPIDFGGSSNTSESYVKTERSKKVVDLNEGKYHLGDVFSNKCDIVLRTTYSDGTYDDKPLTYEIKQIKNTTSGTVLPNNSPFIESGPYKISLSYRLDGSNKTATFNITIKTGVEENGFTLKSLDFKDVHYSYSKTILETNANLAFNIYWNSSDSEEDIFEQAFYKDVKDLVTLKLYKNGGSANVIDEPIELGQSYKFVASFKKYSSITANYEFDVPEKTGYYHLNDATIYSDTFTDSSLHEGVAKMMVVTIDLEAGSSDFTKIEWSQNNLNTVNRMFFGTSEISAGGWHSLKTYYEEVSKGMIEIGGEVFSPYKATYTMEEISADTSYRKLHKTFNDAVEYVKSSNSHVNWSEYDLNRDGYFDNLHFITNCATSEGITWSSPLWPHQYSLYGNTPNVNSPVGNRYETTILGMLSDAITVIHEQGHMFGVPDYYNYSQGVNEEQINYVGSFDMQSHNVGDWNPWSKFMVGWGKPIVVDGSADHTTVTFQSSALTNQFVVIPANIDTYNNSAFDEFIILELFTEDGLNEDFWNIITNNSNQNAGVRLYHVDGRLWNYQTGEMMDDINDIEAALNSEYPGIDLACSNSSTYGDYAGINKPDFHDYKLITVIQKGMVDTFGKPGTASRRVIDFSDLFLTGDTFNFEDYDHFLSKSNVETGLMNNGEEFPYSIYFNDVSRDGCTVTITKN
ncbi:MAG: hypothetical protein IKB70_01995 [Bacilli bacterium]|nr:hypothetical protein [Bacilli bacterium]